MKLLLARFVDLLYPRTCANCGRIGEAAWCAQCTIDLQERPFELIERTLENGLTVLAAGIHTGLLRSAIHAFKFDGAQSLADTLGTALGGVLTRAQVEVDLVTDVPLHPQRERWRGYNQSALLAQVVAEILNAPYESVLRRTRYAAPQVGRDAQSRRQAVDGVFDVTANNLAGLRLLVVDDVVTTGSTLMACASALVDAGAGQVSAACVVSA